MAFPTAVNSQITDSVTQSNVEVSANVPATASGFLQQATAQALANAAHNATANQQNANILHQAITTLGIRVLHNRNEETVAVMNSN
jgi:thymidine phosphorylase